MSGTLPFGPDDILLSQGGHTYIHIDSAVRELSSAGHIVIAKSDLPKVTKDRSGRPKLPATWGQPDGRSKSEVFLDEALGKLALAQWWEQEAVRVEKQRESLVADLKDRMGPQAFTELRADYVAKFLVERGWRRG